MSKNLSLTRRQVLKGAGAAALTGAASLVPAAKASAARAKAPRWAYIVDLRRCIGCRACTVACKAEFSVQISYLVNLNIFTFWPNGQEIREVPALHLATRNTVTTCIPVNRFLAVEGHCEGHGRGCLSDPWNPGEKIGMGYLFPGHYLG